MNGGTVRVETAVGEFEAVLHTQIADARRALAKAREAREYEGIKSFGLRLQYLLEIAEEYRVQVPRDQAPDAAAGADEQAGG